MSMLLEAIERHQGLASRHELVMSRILPAWIDLSAWYGRDVVRVRKGWFARVDERSDVLRAWRVGGRLTCVSAAAFHEGVEPGPVLHIEVPASSVRLRDPDHADRRLGPDAAVVVHWTRHPGPGDRRAVDAQHAEAVAARCGIHAGGVPRAAR